MRRVTIAWVSCLSLAACSGGSQSMPAAGGVNGSLSGGARFTITVPNLATSSTSRGPAYLSNATESVIVTIAQVNGAPYTGSPSAFATNLTTGNPACSGTPLQCSVSVPAPIGSVTFNVATYDAQQTAASPSTPAGNVLSQSSLTMNVVAGGNSATLVLGGVPASLTATPSGPLTPPAATNYLRGNISGLKLWGPFAQTLTLEALDASGEVIIGSGAPTLTLTSPSGALSVSALSSNVFALQATTSGSPAVVTPGTVMLTATATPAAASGAAAKSVTLPVTIAHSIVDVSSGSGGSVAEFYDGNTTPSLTVTSGLSGPRGVAVDANGTVYVGNHGNNTVTEYPAGQTTPSLTITGLSFPEGVAIDPSGNLWEADSGNGDVKEFLPGQTTPSVTLATGLGTLRAVAFDAAGDLWITDQSSNQAIEYAAPVTGSSPVAITLTGTNGISGPVGGATDANENLWIGNSGAADALEFAFPITGSSAPAATISSGLSSPQGVAVDAAGTLFIADVGNNRVMECTAPATSPSCTTPLSVSGALWIAVAP